MELPPLVSGRMLGRYKRFLADVVLDDGREVIAHCPNTGSMKGCWTPGAPVQLSAADNPKRKLPWTLERVDMGQGWVGVHTGRTNPVVEEGIREGRLEALGRPWEVRREVPLELPGHARSRLDLKVVDDSGVAVWIEVKNATLWDAGRIRFPDAVTVRGRKHLDALAEVVARGERGMILFAVNRPEGDMFSPAWSIDPDYSRRLVEVSEAGVEVAAVRIIHKATGLSLGEPLALRLGD